jgi:hypothetical protein
MREEPTSCTGVQASSGDLSAEVKFACPSLVRDAVCTLEEGYLRVEIFHGLVLCDLSGQAYFYVTIFL